MSTEVARFENKKLGRSLFLRYCGSEQDQHDSDSLRRERLQISMPHNSVSFSCEDAMWLGKKLVEMFPVKKEPVMLPFLHENEREVTLVYAEDEALAWQQVADENDWEEGDDEGTMRPLPVSKTPASFILSI